ncbi:MAG TPA: hypothetical protein VJS92_00540 [Candidatus Polarisedimenticolaceae bacterium]|nr:hypothetical protein [Candidatus Polarisedimenticolaceae bacterium]
MSARQAVSARRYARAIERAWVAARGRAAVVSEREWELISSWFARGIPLAIVQEALQAALERPASGGGVRLRSLAYLAPAVEEAWSVVVDGRRWSASAAAEGPERARRSAEAWERCRLEQPSGSALRALLGELLGALAQGGSGVEADARLDQELAGVAPAMLLARVQRDVERSLGSLRTRLSPASWRTTRDTAITDRLRRELSLPRLGGPV